MVSRRGLSFSAYCLKDKRGEGENLSYSSLLYYSLLVCRFPEAIASASVMDTTLSKRVLDGMFSMLYQYTSAVPFRAT